MISALLAAGAAAAETAAEPGPKPDEWKCLQRPAGGRVRVQLRVNGCFGFSESEVELRFHSRAATLFASEDASRRVLAHRVTGPQPEEAAEANRQVSALFDALSPRPQVEHPVLQSICDGVSLKARVLFWCGEERHGPFTLKDTDLEDASNPGCDASKSPAGRVHLWAGAIFAAHKDSPVVKDSPRARARMKKKAASVYTPDGYRLRHDPIEIWDD